MNHLESWSISGSKEKTTEVIYCIFGDAFSFILSLYILECSEKCLLISCSAIELRHHVPEVKIQFIISKRNWIVSHNVLPKQGR